MSAPHPPLHGDGTKDVDISAIIRIAEQAGTVIMDWYRRVDPLVTYKADESPVTGADLASDAFIRRELGILSSYPVLSEEFGVEAEDRKGWGTFWLVDPLDGTKEFIHRIGEFTVNIALIHETRPVAGVIHAPATGETWYATEGGGSWEKRDGRTTALQSNAGETLIATVSRFHLSPLDQEFNRLNKITTVVPAGSSLKFCRVAAGQASLYARFQGSMEWDIAAGHIIAREAGCTVTDLRTGKEPVYNKKNLLNNHFIVSGKGISPGQLLLPGL